MSAKVAGTIMYKTKQGQYDFLVQKQGRYGLQNVINT